MAFITYPLNNIDYTAEDAELFHCTRTSGIWAEDSFPISVTGADNNVTIGMGIAWINNEEFSGKVAALKSAELLDLGIADSTYPRIDVIAIQFNANNNATDVIVKKGTPATNPVRPAIVRSGAVYELYLASIYRPAGATAITASNITDLRMDETVCGLMADSVTKVDMTAIEAQVRAFINNLQSEIDSIRDLSGLMFESEWVEDGVIPVSKGGTGATTAEGALANLGGISEVILWENASPSSSFLAQTLDDELADTPSNYDEIKIEFRTTTSSSFYWTTTIKKDRSGQLIAFAQQGTDGANTLMLSRQVVISTLSVQFRDTEQKNLNTKVVSTSNSSVIPTKVWGIKGVQ